MAEPTPDFGRKSGPDDTAPSAQGNTADYIADHVADSAADGAADSLPDTAPDRAQRTGPDNVSDGAPVDAPGHAAGSALDGAPDSAPDSASDSAADNAPGNAPDRAADTAADSASGNAPDNAPGRDSGEAGDNTPDKAPGNRSGNASDSALVNTPGNTPDNAPGNTPDNAPGNAPDGCSGMALVGTPAQPADSAPGEATELAVFLAASPDVIQVRLSRVQGSAPRGPGATMCVSERALCGTIGGGQLEYMAIDQARALLTRGGEHTEMHVPLGPEIGQCCGGRVTLSLNRMNTTDRAALLQEEHAARAADPHIYLYGAGHVGRALARALAPLPLRTLLVDSRAAELVLCRADIKTCLTPLPESVLRAAPPGAAHIIATHDHALDFLLTSEALARQDAAYVGLIGSKTKRARFLRWHAEQMPGVPTDTLICPIGGDSVPDKRPEVIAALVVAEVLQALAVWAEAPAEA
jgi:xanthine dehydrogenase accessory factor